MPKPSKSSSAPAWAQGLGNKPNNFACGDTNRGEIEIVFKSQDTIGSTSSLTGINSAGPTAVVMNGAQPSAKKSIGTVETNADDEIHEPNNEQVANNSDSNPAHSEHLQRYKEYFEKVGNDIKASMARTYPERPYMSVALDARFFVLYKAIPNEAVDEFIAEFVSFHMKKKEGFNSEEDEEENWDNVIKKLTLITFECKRANPVWVNKDGTEKPFTVTGRNCICTNPITTEQRDQCINSSEDAAKVEKAYEGARHSIDHMKNPNAAAVSILGKYHILHENRKDTDMEAFFWTLAKFVKTEFLQERDNEAEKCNILNQLKTFSDEVVEPVVMEYCGVAVTLDNSDLPDSEIFGVLINYAEKTKEVPINECTDKKGLDPKEPKETISIEVDQYEEVDGFDQNNIKCKCVIS